MTRTMTAWGLARLYALLAGVFFAVDLVWIGIISAGFYQRHIGHLLADHPIWMPALAFYSLYIVAIMVFAVLPGVAADSLKRTLALGAFLGFTAYGTFDLTAMALFKDFPLVVVVVDMTWGAVLTGAVAAAGFLFARRMR